MTEEAIVQICAATRAGAYAHVAAQAAGIGYSTYMTWMRHGENPEENPDYAIFRERVLTARAQARMAAEIIVKREDPLQWLKHVARDRPGDQGWTTVERIESTSLVASVTMDTAMALRALSEEELDAYERTTEKLRAISAIASATATVRVNNSAPVGLPSGEMSEESE
mgnify:CR=1 FL=1